MSETTINPASTDTTDTEGQNMTSWADYQKSVTDHFVGLYGTPSDTTPEAGTFQEMSRQEWAIFVEENKKAHTPAITDEMVHIMPTVIKLPKQDVTRTEAQEMLNTLNEAITVMRAHSDMKARKFDNVHEIRAIDAKVASMAQRVEMVSNALNGRAW